MTTLPDDLPDPVVIIGSEGRIRAANDRAATLLVIPVDELVGSQVAKVLPLVTPAGRLLWDQGLVEAADLDLRTFLLAIGACRVPVQTTARCGVDADGEPTLVISLRRERDAADAMEIIATVSHELRSPLTSIKGYTSLMLSRWEELSDEQKQVMLDQVHHDADRVTRLVSELLDISRLETGRLALQRQPIDLNAIVRTVVDRVRLTHPDIDCAVEIPADLCEVTADPDKVEQVLTNLVENAVKYASPIGMRIVVETTPIDVVVAVHDRGKGIPADDLPHIFERFFRAGHQRPSGTGLGLWISRALVEAHGGRLTADSMPGQGSVFRFTLPLTPRRRPSHDNRLDANGGQETT